MTVLMNVNRRRRLSNAPSPASDSSSLPDDDAKTNDDDSRPTDPISSPPTMTPVIQPDQSKLPTLSPVISNDDDHAGNDDTTDGSHGIGDVPTLPPGPSVPPPRPNLPPRKPLAPRPAVIPRPTALPPRPTVPACSGIGCSMSTHSFFSISIFLLLVMTCVCWCCGWRRRHDLDTSRGEYRRVTSRYTADAFDDTLDDEDDDDGDDDDDEGGYSNNGTHIIELKQFDRGQLSLKEVNG